MSIFKDMWDDLPGLVIFLSAAIAFCFFGMYMSIKTSVAFAEECQARGGKHSHFKYGSICVRDGLVVMTR